MKLKNKPTICNNIHKFLSNKFEGENPFFCKRIYGIWFHSCEIQKQVKLTNGDKIQNSIYLGEGALAEVRLLDCCVYILVSVAVGQVYMFGKYHQFVYVRFLDSIAHILNFRTSEKVEKYIYNALKDLEIIVWGWKLVCLHGATLPSHTRDQIGQTLSVWRPVPWKPLLSLWVLLNPVLSGALPWWRLTHEMTPFFHPSCMNFVITTSGYLEEMEMKRISVFLCGPTASE